MKKQLILAIALLVSVGSFAQKKEIKALEKAVKNNNYAEAKTLVSQLESMEGSMDDKLKDKYYLASASAYFANGAASYEDISKAVETLEKLSGNSVAGENLKQTIENGLLTKANDSYTSKDFSNAAIGFENLYNVNKTDPSYLYYAAVSALTAQDMDQALKYYLMLDDLNYTGVETEYFATNLEGKEEVLDKNVRDNYVRLKTHTNPGERLTESREGEITKNIVIIYTNKGETEKALAAMKKARDANPNDSNLLVTEANLQYKLGNTAKYEELISQALTNDPNNSELLYNLAVLANDSGNSEKAKTYYSKSLELDPTNVNTLTNLAVLILADEQSIIDQMNNLGTSAADNRKYDELKEKRLALYNEAIPYLEKVVDIAPDNKIIDTLVSIYGAVGQDAKAKAIKEKKI
ncbi:tetratricopeptide repeat protein [Psychroserpens sp. NJDZ02]|uniref:tetratricopeptide repeat protein n=1 Tax=Psychroserpens sp. NJDZ02 TaxID=2570561 RepID=UPI0010A9499A|nr:tetratricopeptide repeat protein [Psychroserpens sp. NJDZ02]QCE43160.1 tetratricopeptide repeat protein [Psychroserpens sp. NJDZ02]